MLKLRNSAAASRHVATQDLSVSPPAPPPTQGSRQDHALTVADFRAVCGGLDLTEFRRRFPHPFFIQISSLSDDESELPFGTIVRPSSRPADQADLGVCLVHPVVKRPGGNFAKMILIGRADNNDLVLRQPHVSKFHAYFHQRDDIWQLTDARSSNGTEVDGRALPTGGSAALGNFNELSFAGELKGYFVSEANAHRLLSGDR